MVDVDCVDDVINVIVVGWDVGVVAVDRVVDVVKIGVCGSSMGVMSGWDMRVFGCRPVPVSRSCMSFMIVSGPGIHL